MIVDFRIRPSTKSLIEVTKVEELAPVFEWLGGAPPLEAPSTTLERMDAAGIRTAVVQGRDVETTFGFRVPNEEIADFVEKAPDRLVGLAGIDPNKGRRAIDELRRCVQEFGFLGASVDPYMHRVPIDDRRMWPIYDYCQSRGLIVNLTAGPGAGIKSVSIDDARPGRLNVVANAFPELRIVMSHGGYPWVLEMIAMAMRHPNVYMEASAYEQMPGADAYREAANGVLKSKMMFASAHPYLQFEDRIKIYQEWELDEDAYEAVMAGNATRLLDETRADVARASS